MAASTVPQTAFALISGSGSWGVDFPAGVGEEGISVVERGLAFDTPHGRVENFSVFRVAGSETADGRERLVLNVFAHGWRPGVMDHASFLQTFWVLREAGVRKIIAESTCGSLNRALRPRDLIISADIIDFTQTRLTLLPDRFTYLCTGAQMFCPAIGEELKRAALEVWPSSGRVYGRDDGLIMGVTLGPRFETPAEARWLQRSDCDAVGQSAGPEVFLAREIGACYASSSYVVNWVDGIREQTWDLDGIHEELKLPASRLVLRAMKRLALDDRCGCMTYRKPRPKRYAESIARGASR
jgi:5'-methylthioadenosine phosphorylase